MRRRVRVVLVVIAVGAFLLMLLYRRTRAPVRRHVGAVDVNAAVAFDRSPALAGLNAPVTALAAPDCREPGCDVSPPDDPDVDEDTDTNDTVAPPARVTPAGAAIEQRSQGSRPAVPVIASFDGLGAGFTGPQNVRGGRGMGNPSDNTLAVGPDHIVQIVNGGMAVFTKKGVLFDTTGKVLYGPMRSNAIFAGFGGPCDVLSSGDAVVRYDQLAQRWLYVLPIFSRDSTPAVELTRVSLPGRPGQPGEAAPYGLIKTPAPPPPPSPPPTSAGQPPAAGRGGGRGGRGPAGPPRTGPYSMCYAVSVTTDPLGPYYRYQFIRPLFPDYPRPAIWPDGYYVPSSTSDNFIQKHACVVDRAKMLQGLPATEQCIVIDGVNFLNNADIDGRALPPDGAPNIVMAAGGTQLHQLFDDDGIYAWQFHVDWNDPTKTGLRGPTKIAVAPYHYLCNGQLTRCVPQRGDSNRLDSQGDKLMQRLVYRNVNGHEAIVALHSINTAAGGGGVRWYEFRLDAKRDPALFQQGTFAPDSLYRWLASPGMDRKGNIGIGYSFGGATEFPGQRFAARLANDPPGQLTFHESVLAQGEAAQPRQLRWEDYATTAMDPSDDCTFWYVGDYVKKDAAAYSSRIGAFRVPGCREGTVAGSSFYDTNHDGIRNGAEPGLSGWSIAYAGGQAGKVVTDAAGAFTVTLPADSVFADVNYTFSARVPTRSGWTTTQPTRPLGTGVTRTVNGYRVHLEDDDFVTGVAFGSVCTVPSRGAHDAAYWLGPAGATAMSMRDSNWTRLFDSIDVADGQGRRIRIPRGPAGYDTLRTWLPGAMRGTEVQRRSAVFAVAGLNVVSGATDGSATIADPVVGDWPQIRALLGRGSVALAAADTTAVAQHIVVQYVTLVEQLNGNAATITPFRSTGCPKPF
jgi:hypothetical protein